MDQTLSSYSESIVLSLCKEIEYIRIRSKNINKSLRTCQNKRLTNRLKLELEKLDKNRLKILSISESMFKNSEELSIQFLLEIAKRSNSFLQI